MDRVPHEEIAPLARPVVAKALGCFWAAWVVLNTLRASFLQFGNPLGALERRLLVAAVGVGLSWGMYRILFRLRPTSLRSGIVAAAAMSLPAGLVFSTVNFLVFDMLTPLAADSCHPGAACTMHDLVVEVSDMLINWSFVFAAWGMLYLSLASAAQTRAADFRSAAHREAARLAQLRALRYQVNPHFLFNVLNSLTALVSRRETAEAETLIGEIGSFFRYGLATDPIADTTLSDEVEMQKRYLELERRRFPTRLSIRIDLAPEVANAAVPPLILQPLVENVVKHGVGRTSVPVLVTISGHALAGGMIEIVVADDAAAPAEATADDDPMLTSPDGLGLGLRNVRERLDARFGSAARFDAGRLPAGGFRAALRIPLIVI